MRRHSQRLAFDSMSVVRHSQAGQQVNFSSLRPRRMPGANHRFMRRHRRHARSQGRDRYRCTADGNHATVDCEPSWAKRERSPSREHLTRRQHDRLHGRLRLSEPSVGAAAKRNRHYRHHVGVSFAALVMARFDARLCTEMRLNVATIDFLPFYCTVCSMSRAAR